MSKQGAQTFVVGLVDLFEKELSAERFSLYVLELERYDDEDLIAAAGRVLRRCRFFPALAEVLELVDEAREERAERERTSRPRLPEKRVNPNVGRAGIEHVRKTLIKAGHLPPPALSRENLSIAERRHDVHERLGPRVPSICRFCRELEEAS